MLLAETDPKRGFSVQRIKLEVSKGTMISNSGLGTIIELFDSSPLSKEFARCLPERKSNNSQGSYRTALILLSSLIHGEIVWTTSKLSSAITFQQKSSSKAKCR